MVKDFYIIFFPILINRETIQTVLGKQKMQTPIKMGAIGLALLLGIGLAASARTLSPLSPDAVPQSGTFFSAQDRPPMPFDWLPGLPVYALGQGNFLVDDSAVNYSAIDANGMSHPSSGTMDDTGVPAPPGGWGDGGDGTNSPGGVSSSYVLPTNGLFLTITGLTNGVLSLTLNDATDMVYEIFSSLSLTNPVWQIEQAVFPDTNQNPTPFTVDMQDRTNALFLFARDWNGVISDGNTTVPEWWLYYYLGTVDLSETNLDLSGSGNTLLWDYQNGLDPNVIFFALNVTNQDFNGPAPIQVTVSGGVPSYMAVLVDNAGFSSANWKPYNSNLVVNLGSVEGWHTVWVGLRGLPPIAQQTWDQIQLKLVLTPPVLIVTNPIPGIVTQPFIQLQGYALLNLASISYDLLNSNTFVTNQQAFVTTRQFDTNNFEYTTNGFACFNIPLAIGTNTVTLHATDMAGNVTITNLVYILDPTANTNPPVISLSWPQNNTCISGTNFPVRGVVNDPFATVTAQIVNAGGTNGITGLVEQNGSFWIENMPLGSGTNYLTITATNTAGYGSATNIAVIQSSVTLTISSVTFNDPVSPTATVTGSLVGSNGIVLVNGIQASNNGNNTWTAYYVPAGDSGTAAFSADATANGVPDAMDAQFAEDVVRGPEVALVDYRYNILMQVWWAGTPQTEIVTWTMNWDYGSPGNYLYGNCYTPGWYFGPTYDYYQINWDATGSGPSLYGETSTCGEIGSGTVGVASATLPPYGEKGALEQNQADQSGQSHQQYQYHSSYVLRTGGQAGSTQQNLWCINVSLPYDSLLAPIPPSEITVAGQTLDSNFNAYLLLPNNSEVNITPTAPLCLYTFLVSATEYTLLHTTECTATGNPDNTRTTIGIDERVDLSGMPANTAWSVSGGGSLSTNNGSGTTFTASSSPGGSTVFAQVATAQPLSVPLNVIAPSGVAGQVRTNNGVGTNGPPNKQIGASTTFTAIILPTTVSFLNITNYEVVNPFTVTWPDNTVTNITPRVGGLNDLGGCGDALIDTITDGPFPTNCLFNGTNYQDFSYTMTYEYRYENADDYLIKWATLTVVTAYKGSTLQCSETWQGISGSWQGPWQ